ncbi:MAG: histidine kinase dimerization/phospho-acceptor domain-containing protein, partial [Bacteroidota bacterium]
MNKRSGILLIFLTTFAIIGIAITQIYWIKNAYELKNDQFEKRIVMGLKTVSNTLFEMQNQSSCQIFYQDSTNLTTKNLFDNLNYSILDSLISAELVCMKMGIDFEYGVYLNGTSHLIGGNYKLFEKQILDSQLKISLGCLQSGSAYYLALFFPNRDLLILRNMIGGFILSGFFVLIVGLSFIYTVIITYRQKKISLMKNDFVNNMTHEFKTPISTVSLASEMLLRPDVQNDSERTK